MAQPQPTWNDYAALKKELGRPDLSYPEGMNILRKRRGLPEAPVTPAPVRSAAPPAAPVPKPAAKPAARPAPAPISAKAPPIAPPAAPKPSVMLPADLTRSPLNPAPVVPPSADAPPVSILGTPLPFRLPIVVQPEKTKMEPRLPENQSPEAIEGGAQAAYEKALNKIEMDETLEPEGKKQQIAKIENIYKGPRDVSGSLSRTPTPTTVKDLFGGGYMGTILGALAPQTIMTPEETKNEIEIERIAYKQAMDYKAAHPKMFEGLSTEETAKRLKALRYYIKTGEPLKGDGGFTPTGLVSDVAKAALTTKLPDGRIVESPLITAGKMLNVAEAGLVATGRSGLQYLKGEEVTGLKNLESELKTGMGFMGAGEDIGRVTGEAIAASKIAEVKAIKDKAAAEGRALTPDEQTKIENEQKNINRYVNFSTDFGGFTGFIASMLTPGDAGLSTAGGTGIKTAKGAVEIATAFKPEMALAEKIGVGAKGALLGTVEGGFDAWLLRPRTGGNLALSRQLESSTKKLLESGDFQGVTKTTLDFAANPKVADILMADKKAAQASLKDKTIVYDPAPTKAALKAEYESANYPGYATFEEFQDAAQRYGIDTKQLPGERVLIEAEVPQNVLSLEAEAAKRQVGGTGPMRTASLEDIAIGGKRSDLYYNAMLDEVDDAVKKTLIDGAPIKKTDLFPAIDAYMNLTRANGGNVARVAEDITNSLAARGINIGDRALGGTTKSSTGSARFILPQDTVARNALDKAFRIDVTRNFLNNFTKKTGITGIQKKIGGITASVKDAEAILKKVKESPAGRILDDIRERFKESRGQPVELSADEAEALQQYFVGQFKTDIGGASVNPLQPTEMYSPEMVRSVFSRMSDPNPFSTTPLTLNTKDFNQLVKSSIAIEASPMISAKTESKLFEIGSSQTKEGKTFAYNEFVRNVYKPKDITENALGSIISDFTKKGLYRAPEAQSSVTRGIVAEINGRFATLPDRFKLSMREKLNFYRGNRPEAFSAVMVEEFTNKVVQPRDVSGAFGIVDAAEGFEAGAREMFRTNLSSMFGAYERTGEIISSTSGIKQIGKSGRITVEEMRDLVTVMMHIPGVETKYVLPFVDLIKKGEHTQAINLLQRMHADYFGYSIQQILTRKANIPVDGIARAIDVAAAKAANNTLSGATFESAIVSGRNGVRSPIKAYEAASSQGMTFKPENFKELLVANYYAKSQTNIINDVMAKASESYPGLFPSDALIGRLAKDDFEVTSSALINAIDNAVPTKQMPLFQLANSGDDIRGALLQISSDADLKILMQAAIKDSIKKESLSTILSEGPVKSEYVDTLTKIIQRKADVVGQGNKINIAEIKKELQNLVDNLATPPGTTYTESFGSMIKPSATEATMANNLARVNEALRAPYSSSIQGAVDRMTSIPAIGEASAGIKGEVIKGANVKSLTDTLDLLEVASSEGKLDEALIRGGDKMTRDILRLEDIVDRQVSTEMTKSLEELAALKVKATSEFWKTASGQRIVEWLGLKVSAGIGGFENFAKGGMLAGVYAANMVYIAGNIITGPSIVTSTLGLRQGFNSAKGIFDRDTWNILSSVYAPHAPTSANKVLFTAPDGTIYTTHMMRDYVIDGVLGKSQASAELTNSLINAAGDWAGKNDLIEGWVDKGLLINDPSVNKDTVVKFLRRNFSNKNDINTFSAFANMCDTQFRLGVFKRALQAGESVDAASKLGRESLFDYGKVTDLEKKTISKIFWFWNFRRNNDRTLMTSMLMDPRSTKAAFASGRGWSYAYNLVTQDYKGEERLDQKYAMKDYSGSRAFLSLIEDPENKRRYAVYGPIIPSVSAVADLVDYLSIPLSYVGAKAGISPDMTIGEVGSSLGTLVVQQSNPLIQSGLVAASIGFDIGSGRDLGGYLDPKLMWYVRANPGAAAVFDTLVITEPIPEWEEKPWQGYYQGRQWRIAKNDKQSMKNWSAIQTALTLAAAKRTMADAAPFMENYVAPIGEGYLPEMQISTGDNSVDFWKSVGVVAAVDAPLLAEARFAGQYAARSELEELNKLSIPLSSRIKREAIEDPGPNATIEEKIEYKRKMNIVPTPEEIKEYKLKMNIK